MIVRPTRTEAAASTSEPMPVASLAAGPFVPGADVELRIDRLIVERPLLGRGGARLGHRFEAALAEALERRLATTERGGRRFRAAAEARRTLRLPSPPEAGPQALAEALADVLVRALTSGGVEAPAEGGAP